MKSACWTRSRLQMILCFTTLLLSGCDSDNPSKPENEVTQAESEFLEQLRPEVTAFCSGCHAMPAPDTFPRNAWHHEVEKAYEFFHDSDRADLKPLPMGEVVKWFRLQASEKLALHPTTESPSPLKFRREIVPYDGMGALRLAISCVFVRRSKSGPIQFCDMGSGYIGELQHREGALRIDPGPSPKTLHPARIETSDLNGDGVTDFLIAELGSYLPGDHNKGQVIWFRPGSKESTTVLLEGIGRVADARAADFDGDGDEDVVVAEFGWIKTGGIHLLEQTGVVNGEPQFRHRQLDQRHGTIHVPVADLDQDGDMDFIALISQEHEEITAFINRGDATFEKQTILPGGDPAFGSSGIELADMDGDGDLDVVYVNGDSLDSKQMKPYHGVRWLQNEGKFPFRKKEIAAVPGACRATVGDLDADGDLDVVVGAWIPPENTVPPSANDGQFETLLWFEQSGNGDFKRHSILRASQFGYMAADLADLDQDGDLEIVAGHFGSTDDSGEHQLDVFWNPTKKRTEHD